MAQAEAYGAASRELLGKAREALAQGDLIQASEKGWGAAAQIVKALAQSHGWRHDGHRELFQVISRLALETGDQQITVFFHVANSLHSNFYENWMTEDQVQVGVEQIQELLTRLESLLGSP